MPIPKINLIPAAYYLRKKLKAAIAWSVVGVLVLLAALAAFGITQSNKNKELMAQQAEWQAKAQKVEETRTAAAGAASAVADVQKKVTFINDALKANSYWATVFEGIRDYTYPGVIYTSLKPTPNGSTVAMHIRVVGDKKVNPVRALNWYVRNLRRSPMVKAVLPSGYPTQSADTSGSMSLGGPPMAGGPAMPGGPPMAGAPMPGGAYVGSAQSLTAGVVDAASQYSQALGGPAIGMPQISMPQTGMATDMTSLMASVPLPPTPPMYDVDVTAELVNPISLVTTGTVRTQ